MAAEEQKIEKLQDEINQLREELQRKERELFDLKFKKVYFYSYEASFFLSILFNFSTMITSTALG